MVFNQNVSSDLLAHQLTLVQFAETYINTAAYIVMWVMSDRATPHSYRMMQGFGVIAFTLINQDGQQHFVKFHWIPELGVHSLVWDEALKLGGQDPGVCRLTYLNPTQIA